MRRHLIVLLALALALAVPGSATVRRAKLQIDLTTGAVTAFTTSTIYSRRILFQSDKDNTATVYIGLKSGVADSGTGDTALDPTSATTLSNTCLVELAPGQGWSPSISYLQDRNDEEYKLSDYVASGTTGEKARLAFEKVTSP